MASSCTSPAIANTPASPEHTSATRAPFEARVERVTASIGFGPDRMPDHHLTRTQEVVALVDVPLVPDHHVGAANGSDGRARSVTGMTWSEPDHRDRTLGTRPPRDRERDGCSLAFRDDELGALARGGERGRFGDARRAHFGRDDLARDWARRPGPTSTASNARTGRPSAVTTASAARRSMVATEPTAASASPGLDKRLVQQRFGCTRGCVRRRADSRPPATADGGRRRSGAGATDWSVTSTRAGPSPACERNGPLERALDDAAAVRRATHERHRRCRRWPRSREGRPGRARRPQSVAVVMMASAPSIAATPRARSLAPATWPPHRATA